MKAGYCVVALIVLCPLHAHSGIVKVPAMQSTIQRGVNAASAGDTILISPGTYYEHVEILKPLALISTSGSDLTTVDGKDSVSDSSSSVLTFDGAGSCKVVGITIQKGRGMRTAAGELRRGGGIYARGTNLTIENCVITQNNVMSDVDESVVGGGGICVESPGRLHIIGSQIVGNSAQEHNISSGATGSLQGGGGILAVCNGVQIEHSAIVNNYLYSDVNVPVSGGGIAIIGDSAQIQNTFVESNRTAGDNFTPSGGIALRGAGLYLAGTAHSLYDNLIRANETQSFGGGTSADARGAGAYLSGNYHVIRRSLWLSNSAVASGKGAYGSGGGICFSGQSVQIDSCAFANNLAQGSSGSVGMTSAGASGGGALADGTGLIRQSFFWNNRSSASAGGAYAGSTASGGGLSISGSIECTNSTILGNQVEAINGWGYGSFGCVSSGGGVDLGTGGQMSGSIVYGCTSTATENGVPITALGGGAQGAPACVIGSTDMWSNSPTNVDGGVAFVPGQLCNLVADPVFFDVSSGDLELRDLSPCAPAHNPCALLLGAAGVKSADMIPPAYLCDLTLSESSPYSLKLTWHAAYDVFGYRVYKYDLRVATAPFSSLEFSAQKRIPTVPIPEQPGSVQNALIRGLQPGTQYYFMLSWYDRVGRQPGYSILTPVATPPVCCQGITGNVDCDLADEIDIADLTALIDYLYISFSPLCCVEEANIDGSLDGNIDISDLSALIDYLYISFTPPAACQ